MTAAIAKPGELYIPYKTQVSMHRNNAFRRQWRIRILKLNHEEMFRLSLMGLPVAVERVPSKVVDGVVREYKPVSGEFLLDAWAKAVNECKQLNERAGG